MCNFILLFCGFMCFVCSYLFRGEFNVLFAGTRMLHGRCTPH
uniref:Uncharacterized protein n=1 Tax=Arundo donax TaxID=35708 RepID=A0A0A8YNB0_ARUDO